jgi:hypothetical protein
MLRVLKKHWPEYLMEGAELALFMISASLSTILLYHPTSPAVRAIPSEFFRRVLTGLAMGLTLATIVYSPWGKRSGAHMNPAFTLTFFRLGKVAAWDAFFYVAAQFAGGVLGILAAVAVAASSMAHPSVNYGLKDSPGLWKEFVPIAFHVDYWDHLGWRDKWGSKAFSERQRTYAQSWHSDSVYTPGFVLNGREWRAWPGLKNVPSASSLQVGVLEVTSTDRGHWHVEFSSSNPSNFEFHAALLVSDLSSEVKAGENGGRRLVHDFVALELAKGVLSASGKAARGDFTFHGTRKGAEGGLAVAVWLSSPGSLEPVQATGGWLPER